MQEPANSKETDDSLLKERFNLTDLYTGIHDPQIMSDVEQFEHTCKAFHTRFKNNLIQHSGDKTGTMLGEALTQLSEVTKLSNKLYLYLYLVSSCNNLDAEIKTVRSRVFERLSHVLGESLSFFNIEVGAISEEKLKELIELDDRVKFHAPYVSQIIKLARYNLSEEVERALSIRSSFGPSEMVRFVGESLAKLTITIPQAGQTPETLGLEAALSRLSDKDSAVRSAALKAINEALGKEIAPLTAVTLNMVSGLKSVDEKERGYTSIMAARNIENQVSDEVVFALHRAAQNQGAKLAQRYYRLLAKQIGKPVLAWSDRNAPVAQANKVVTWDESKEIVLNAYQSFSPTLAKEIEIMFRTGRVDAPTYPGKATGAFNFSVVLPRPLGVRSYNLLNFSGKLRDIMVMAHELGHAVHGILAGNAQGPLMSQPPIAYAETASVFGEMITFQHLLTLNSQRETKLPLLMSKLSDFMNTVVRQISFSVFEQRVHSERGTGQVSQSRLTEIWRQVLLEFYGAEGDVFEYKDSENLWSYITHFFRPFYVYGYAFGELLTQSLFAVRKDFGDRFEPLYLELLRAGDTKDVIELVKPFGLDPTSPTFWENGISCAEGWLSAAEELI